MKHFLFDLTVPKSSRNLSYHKAHHLSAVSTLDQPIVTKNVSHRSKRSSKSAIFFVQYSMFEVFFCKMSERLEDKISSRLEDEIHLAICTYTIM